MNDSTSKNTIPSSVIPHNLTANLLSIVTTLYMSPFYFNHDYATSPWDALSTTLPPADNEFDARVSDLQLYQYLERIEHIIWGSLGLGVMHLQALKLLVTTRHGKLCLEILHYLLCLNKKQIMGPYHINQQTVKFLKQAHNS